MQVILSIVWGGSGGGVVVRPQRTKRSQWEKLLSNRTKGRETQSNEKGGTTNRKHILETGGIPRKGGLSMLRKPSKGSRKSCWWERKKIDCLWNVGCTAFFFSRLHLKQKSEECVSGGCKKRNG